MVPQFLPSIRQLPYPEVHVRNGLGPVEVGFVITSRHTWGFLEGYIGRLGRCFKFFCCTVCIYLILQMYILFSYLYVFCMISVCVCI